MVFGKLKLQQVKVLEEPTKVLTQTFIFKDGQSVNLLLKQQQASDIMKPDVCL